VCVPLNVGCKGSVQVRALHDLSAAVPLASVAINASTDSYSSASEAIGNAPAIQLCLHYTSIVRQSTVLVALVRQVDLSQ
jgi:hypothetical protein